MREEGSWEEALEEATRQLGRHQGSEMACVIGEFSDLESMTAMRDLMHRLDCDNFELRANATKLDADLRANYLMNSSIQGIDQADLLLLIGSNPRYESPVLNSRILRNTRKNNLAVALIGTPHDLNYDYTHLGTTTHTIDQLLLQTHLYSQTLAQAKLPMILMG